ncbi:MAG: membrane integrity-associated transporter subunit PqiC [Nitrosomonadales bacterium]|nr:membrane integrity-associated transporter subunit PqiC [Nitrosomonadales bacterium]MBT4183578.1 membrane integrity-associated transporter subunit PqiC [Nitrosomonadales bacterium]MBT7120871.1 membrane integrity-associated transporter subunit PqiC [Nitrosomonadales bacterium]MBT7482124.1 membrane integrity-associated transporter subunit PqiC [Nitrosomonadales bacterium]
MKPHSINIFAKYIALMFVTFLIFGCAKNSKPIEYYMLDASVGISSNKSLELDKGPLIGLGPIRLPEYLDRPQMVVAVSENKYKLIESHRWAEKLDQNISLALFRALPGQLGTDRMIRYPWPQRPGVDYQIKIDILELNIDPTGQSRLVAQWSIKSKDKTLLNKRSSFIAKASTTDVDKMVQAQSECLTKLGQEIVSNLKPLLK